MVISDDTRKKLINRIKLHERYAQFPYHDTQGFLTIGYGRNLDTVGIAENEANYCLDHDVDFHVVQLNNNYVWFSGLDETRKSILIEMSYNLGFKNFQCFEKMLRALSIHNYDLAANEMLDSVWHKQVGKRAEDLANIMRTGHES